MTLPLIPPATNRSPGLLSTRVFAGMIGCFLFLGILVFSWGAALAGRSALVWAWAIGGTLIAFGGFEVTIRASRWPISLLGLCLMSMGLGLATGPVLSMPDAGLLRAAVMLTLIGIAVMTMVAWISPAAIRAFGAFVLGTMAGIAFVFLWGNRVAPAIGMESIGWPALLLSAITCAYIDYYWTRALEASHTIDAAADVAASFYVDPLRRFLDRLNRST